MSADLDENSPEQVEETPAEQPQAPAPAQAAAPQQEQAPAQAPAEAPAEPEVEAEKPAAAPAPAPVEKTPEQDAIDMTHENVKFGQDLSNGHIQPETYKSLWDKKSTLGKVSTLFGLMVAGAGAGLTHQPNAVMKMMDQQIQNDLEAQKTNESNKQNWVKISTDQMRNKALNALTNSETTKNWTDNDYKTFLNQQKGVIETQGSLNAKNNMIVNYIHEQQDIVNRLPPGPARDKAQTDLNQTIAPVAMKQIYENNLKISQMGTQLSQAAKDQGTKTNMPPEKGFAEPGNHYDVVDQKKLNEGFKKGLLFGKDAGQVPGAIPEEKHAEINKEIGDLSTNRNNWADAQDAYNKLVKIKNAGQVPGAGASTAAATALGSIVGLLAGKGSPAVAGAGGALGHFAGALAGESVKGYFERQRQVQVDALVQRLRSGGMGDEAARSQAEAILPKWADKKEDLPEIHYQLQQHFKANEDNKMPELKRYGLMSRQPKYQFVSSKEESTADKLANTGKKLSGSVDDVANAVDSGKNKLVDTLKNLGGKKSVAGENPDSKKFLP